MDLLGLAAVHSGSAARAVECYERAATLYRELDDRTGLVTALVMLAEMGSDHPGTPVTIPPADPALPLHRAEEAVAVARSIDWRGGEAYALMGLAFCLTGRGDYGRALEAARAGLAIAEDIEHHQWLIASRLALAGLYLELNAATLAQAELDRADAIADAVGSAYWTRMLTAFRAGAAVMQGDLGRADTLIQQLAAPDRGAVDPTRMLRLRAQVELALESGDAERALARIDEFVATATQQVPAAFISLYVWLLQGEVLRRLGHTERAAAVLETVLQAALARAASPLVWRAHVALGRAAQALGRRAVAGGHFDAARTIVGRLASELPGDAEPALGGASVRVQFLTASMAHLPRQRGPTSLRTDKALHGGLTARERQVAALIARGKSNREIAEALVVADRTVETHIGNIFAKLGSNSRAQVAAWAVENGLGASTE
jgi:DNA-binding CsgD family transcriptional regulator